MRTHLESQIRFAAQINWRFTLAETEVSTPSEQSEKSNFGGIEWRGAMFHVERKS
jgi:hypothetical protein